jgi:hypothetical protein
MVNNTNNLQLNFPIDNLTYDTPRVYETTTHLFNIPEILLIFAIFTFLAYWYIRVSKSPEEYKAWKNPNGREVNLYRLIRWIFWIYVVMVIILCGIQIVLAR